MTRHERSGHRRAHRGQRPEELAALCVQHAAAHGIPLVLRPDTPVIPDGAFPFDRYSPSLTEPGTWSDIDRLVRRLGATGCTWVNLWFSVEDDGRAVVRFEAKPDGDPLPGGGIPVCTGSFDCRWLVSREGFRRLQPRSPELPESSLAWRLDRQAAADLVPPKRQGLLGRSVAASLADLREVLGPDLLSRLLREPDPSLLAYTSGEFIPLRIAARIEILALVTALTRGSFDATGIRAWWVRPHPRLSGASPLQLLDGDWSSDELAVELVLAAAAALLA
jgi:hypothetical protein